MVNRDKLNELKEKVAQERKEYEKRSNFYTGMIAALNLGNLATGQQMIQDTDNIAEVYAEIESFLEEIENELFAEAKDA